MAAKSPSTAARARRIELFLTSTRAQCTIIGIAAALVLALAIAYFFAAQPARDEFCRASLTPTAGLAFRYSYDMWSGFTGRWLAMIVYGAVLPGIDVNSLAYAAALIALFFIWFAGFLFGVDAIFGASSPRGVKVLLALLLLAIFWCGAPSHEAIYWLTGATEYGLPFALLMLSFRLATRLGDQRSGRRSAVAAGIAGVLAAGAHELAGILLFGAATCIVLALLRLKHHAALRNALILLVFAGVGLALSAGAPGNFIRSHRYVGGDLLLAGALTVRPDQTPIGWLADGRLLALSLFLLMTPAFRAARPRWTKSDLPVAWLVPLFSLLAIVGCTFLTCYVQGTGPAGRTRDMFYALFVVGWLASLVALTPTLNLTPSASHTSRLLSAIGAALLAAGLLTAPATAASLLDLPYALGEWRHAHQTRERVIRTASQAGKADVVLSPIAPIPAPLQDNGILADASNWSNGCAAEYYRVRSVRVVGGAQPASEAHRAVWLHWFGGNGR